MVETSPAPVECCDVPRPPNMCRNGGAIRSLLERLPNLLVLVAVRHSAERRDFRSTRSGTSMSGFGQS
jgi:hypothetical protein